MYVSEFLVGYTAGGLTVFVVMFTLALVMKGKKP